MSSRPDIILIHTDQHRADCLSVAGHPELITPNLDGLALRGTRFTNAHTPAPLCSPARHSLLTGCSPATNGVLSNLPARIARPEATLPALLRRAGYQTLHVGRSMHQHPGSARYGFDYCFGQPHTDAYSVYHEPDAALVEDGRVHQLPPPAESRPAAGRLHRPRLAVRRVPARDEPLGQPRDRRDRPTGPRLPAVPVGRHPRAAPAAGAAAVLLRPLPRYGPHAARRRRLGGGRPVCPARHGRL